MATEIIKTVQPSGGDYTSLSAWEAGEQRDLVAADEIATAECYVMSDTTSTTIDGWTTDATRYIRVYTPVAERHDGKWDTSAYRLEVTDNFGIGSTENNIKIDGLQVFITLSTAGASDGITFISNNTGTIEISNCIIKSTGDNSGSAISQGGAGGSPVINVWNTVAYDFLRSGFVNGGIRSNFSGVTLNVFNSTFYNFNSGVFQQNGTVNITNSAVFGNVDDFNGTITVDYCASDDGDGTNSVTPVDWDDVFEDVAGRDFHLKSTDTDLIGAGTDDPGSGLYSDDIDGESRTSPWDIGADEFVSVGGFVPYPNPRYSLDSGMQPMNGGNL